MSVTRKCTGYSRSRELKKSGLYPFYLNFSERDRGAARLPDSREIIMCGSNDYLGLSTDPRVCCAAAEASRRYGAGCTGSRLLNGNLDLHDHLERKLAEFFGKPAALLLTTGYQTNLAAVTGLCGPGDHILIDKQAHASLVDAARLSRARVQWFAHNDTRDLTRKLDQLPEKAGRMVVVDGVYSMEGDLCPLPELVRVCRQYGATLLVDDAHGAGVLAEGRGTCAHYGLMEEVPLVTLTFSKAFGSTGGAILGDEEVIDYLRHNARSLLFSASLSPANTAAALESLRILQEEPWRSKEVISKADFMRRELTALGYPTGAASQAPIVPIDMVNEKRTLMAWNLLIEQGVYVNAVLPPAASPRLRSSYMTVHTDEQLARALEGFAAVRDQLLHDDLIH
ncbi:pyridoxal phosphate-dependent aminotransferase family protein [Streptomyces sp. V1I1]|uniref:aminotransferase class I/II-fold pyridoxal phosphate-dependent enzyme n=1 Tax=Streptomyces sp. V1I1 TaxID=3042272 RepID=UPI00278B7AB3|nr:pyridoxal phosphate-dependent aminotransferase family protein [Streptomyces sp. V1I1]MDQ0945675.1 8-amino-7-oxononanoate synthase [Streptomyces sp. V1I1]